MMGAEMFLQEQLKGSLFLPSKRKENRNRKGMDHEPVVLSVSMNIS